MSIQEIMSALRTIRAMYELTEDHFEKVWLYNSYQVLAQKADNMGANPEIW